MDASERNAFIIFHWLVNKDDLYSQLHRVRLLVIKVPIYHCGNTNFPNPNLISSYVIAAYCM